MPVTDSFGHVRLGMYAWACTLGHVRLGMYATELQSTRAHFHGSLPPDPLGER